MRRAHDHNKRETYRNKRETHDRHGSVLNKLTKTKTHKKEKYKGCIFQTTIKQLGFYHDHNERETHRNKIETDFCNTKQIFPRETANMQVPHGTKDI